MSEKKKDTPLEKLKWFLKHKHPNYTVDDVYLSKTKGFLRTTKPCNCTMPPYNGYTVGFHSGKEKDHYHTIDISGVGYKGRDEKGRFISCYKLWYELHGFLDKMEDD